MYLSSRWFELQDAIKKFNPRQALNDFYNIVLERPKDDPAGYDVLFVDAAYKGAIASRISHSCVPNCEVRTLGQLPNSAPLSPPSGVAARSVPRHKPQATP